MAREAGTLENSLEGAGLGSRSKVRGAGAARGWGSESRRVAAGFFQAREQFLSCLTHSETHRSLVHTGQCVCRECAHRTGAFQQDMEHFCHPRKFPAALPIGLHPHPKGSGCSDVWLVLGTQVGKVSSKTVLWPHVRRPSP